MQTTAGSSHQGPWLSAALKSTTLLSPPLSEASTSQDLSVETSQHQRHQAGCTYIYTQAFMCDPDYCITSCPRADLYGQTSRRNSTRSWSSSESHPRPFQFLPRYSSPWINTSVHMAIHRKQWAHKQARKMGKKDADCYRRLETQTEYMISQANKRYMEENVSKGFSSLGQHQEFRVYTKSKGQESTGTRVSPLKDKGGFPEKQQC